MQGIVSRGVGEQKTKKGVLEIITEEAATNPSPGETKGKKLGWSKTRTSE